MINKRRRNQSQNCYHSIQYNKIGTILASSFQKKGNSIFRKLLISSTSQERYKNGPDLGLPLRGLWTPFLRLPFFSNRLILKLKSNMYTCLSPIMLNIYQNSSSEHCYGYGRHKYITILRSLMTEIRKLLTFDNKNLFSLVTINCWLSHGYC